jgi:hypothetical protein
MVFSNNSSKRNPLKFNDKNYYASGDWKCLNSPTGGHWWNCNVKPYVCKICGKIKSEPLQ